MKLVALTSAALLAATTAFAGNLNYDASAEVPVVEEVTTAGGGGSLGGSAGWIVPLVAIVLIGAAIGASDHDE